MIFLHMEIESAVEVNDSIAQIRNLNADVSKIQVRSPKSNIPGAVALMVVLDRLECTKEEMVQIINAIDHVLFVLAQ